MPLRLDASSTAAAEARDLWRIRSWSPWQAADSPARLAHLREKQAGLASEWMVGTTLPQNQILRGPGSFHASRAGNGCQGRARVTDASEIYPFPSECTRHEKTSLPNA